VVAKFKIVMFCVKRLDAWEIKPTERIEAFQVCQVPTKYEYCNIACLKSSHVLVTSTQMYPYPILKAFPRWKIYSPYIFLSLGNAINIPLFKMQSLFNVLFTLEELAGDFYPQRGIATEQQCTYYLRASKV
jgi:hypothetical protein